jgi:tRNA modification GTPase
MDQVDTIAAIATPLGIGGIGVVRVSGPAALTMAQRVFVRPSGRSCTSLKSHRVYHGFVVNGTGERVDEVLLCLMRQPYSYTREDVAEISCHGGVMTTSRRRFGAGHVAEPVSQTCLQRSSRSHSG